MKPTGLIGKPELEERIVLEGRAEARAQAGLERVTQGRHTRTLSRQVYTSPQGEKKSVNYRQNNQRL